MPRDGSPDEGSGSGRATAEGRHETVARALPNRGGVAAGAADVAPIDAYAYRLLQKYRGDLTSKLRTVARTARTPIPPLVASIAPVDSIEKAQGLRAAFTAAHRDPALQVLLAGLEVSLDPEATGACDMEHPVLGKLSADEVRRSAILQLINMGARLSSWAHTMPEKNSQADPIQKV